MFVTFLQVKVKDVELIVMSAENALSILRHSGDHWSLEITNVWMKCPTGYNLRVTNSSAYGVTNIGLRWWQQLLTNNIYIYLGIMKSVSCTPSPLSIRLSVYIYAQHYHAMLGSFPGYLHYFHEQLSFDGENFELLLYLWPFCQVSLMIILGERSRVTFSFENKMHNHCCQVKRSRTM